MFRFSNRSMGKHSEFVRIHLGRNENRELNLVSQFFIFLPYDNLFNLKSSFHFRDVQIGAFLSFPLFIPVGHCFRG